MKSIRVMRNCCSMLFPLKFFFVEHGGQHIISCRSLRLCIISVSAAVNVVIWSVLSASVSTSLCLVFPASAMVL